MAMTEEQRAAFIESFWVKLNSLGYMYVNLNGLDDNFEVNTFTKQLRNTLNGDIINLSKKNKTVFTNSSGETFEISSAKLLKVLKILGN